MENNLKKIGILTFWEFPEGMAPTTRILAYSKGFVKNKVEVEIFSFRRIFKDEVKLNQIKKIGSIGGVKYSYIHYFNNLGKWFKLIRIIDELLLRFKLILKVFQSNRRKSFDAFLFSFDDLNSLTVYTKLFKLFSFPLVFVADEFPIPIRDNMQDSVPEDMLVEYRKYHRSFAGRILMSNALKEFYNISVLEKQAFILNTIVDVARFDNISPNYNSEKNYMCYMGNMSLKKDDVLTIILAFEAITKEFPEVKLHLYGTPDDNDKSEILSAIENWNLQKSVFIKGRASFNEVPLILMNATVLVNAQPITKRAEGGFPTKLGEYLLSKKPAVFTDSGDISFYIKDNQHAFVVPPQRPDLYAEKLLYILKNYTQAMSVAKEGNLYIRKNFNATTQTKSLIEFLKNL